MIKSSLTHNRMIPVITTQWAIPFIRQFSAVFRWRIRSVLVLLNLRYQYWRWKKQFSASLIKTKADASRLVGILMSDVLTAAGSHLWMPEHSMHRVIPRLMEAHRGSSSPQSQHTWLPEPLRAILNVGSLWWGGPAPWEEAPLPKPGVGCGQTEKACFYSLRVICDQLSLSHHLCQQTCTTFLFVTEE